QSLFKLGQVDEAMRRFREAARFEDPESALAAIAVLIPGDSGSSNQDVLDARRKWSDAQGWSVRSGERGFDRGYDRAESGGRPLRIGYVSAFFPDHNWMKPVWGLINRHDRKEFEVHLFSDGAAERIEHGYCRHPEDHVHDISGLSTEDAMRLIES